MAAALAHELSQPLTALNSYAEASRALVSKAGMPVDERMHLLSDISSRMAADAMRASAVVKRLREFFRTGSTQLERVAMEALVHESVAASARRAQALDIELQQYCDEQLPSVLIDPVQIGVVLRNLLTNALDAAGGSTDLRNVRIRTTAHDGAVLVEVLDSGAGVPEEKLHSLFEAGSSDKPGGMGVGLSICRAIVEAHGGSLWAQPGPGGHFCFNLPMDRPQNSGAHDAP
jgi:signal transduction histidine kinase